MELAELFKGRIVNFAGVVIICSKKAYYYDFFVNLQLIRGGSVQDIGEEEALFLYFT